MIPSALSDTPTSIQRLWLVKQRQLSPQRRLQMAAQMYQTVRQLMLSGLRQRYPQ